MAVAFLTPDTLADTLRRIDAIREETPRQWGTMDALHMFVHMRHVIRISLEEEEGVDRSTFMKKYGARLLLYHSHMPWPKGKIQTSSGLGSEPTDDFNTVKEDLKATVQRFVETSETTPDRITLYPAFGPQRMRYWQRLHGSHMEHHLRQFGV